MLAASRAFDLRRAASPPLVPHFVQVITGVSRLNTINWQTAMKTTTSPTDLQQSMRLGVEHIRNSVNRDRHCRPYFRFQLTDSPVWSQHESLDTPHAVGRFLHALNVSRDMIGPCEDAELLNGLRTLLFASCDHGDGFAWDDMADTDGPIVAVMHHQREALLGLLAVWELFRDPEAERYARALVAAMDKATRATGTYPGTGLSPEAGWLLPAAGTLDL